MPFYKQRPVLEIECLMTALSWISVVATKTQSLQGIPLPSMFSNLEEIFTKCDVISLHVHVTDETKYMINKNLFGYINKDCYIINTSRGEIVNEKDIVNGLKSKTITGYATDVVENEFDTLTKSPIIKAMNEGENIIVTPHVGGMTIEGQTKAYEWSINKL